MPNNSYMSLRDRRYLKHLVILKKHNKYLLKQMIERDNRNKHNEIILFKRKIFDDLITLKQNEIYGKYGRFIQ